MINAWYKDNYLQQFSWICDSFYFITDYNCCFVGHPKIHEHPAGGKIPLRGSITLMCGGSGLGTLVYSWERSSGGNWTTVSDYNTTSYTTDTTLAIGQYMYRCRVNNDAGSVVSNVAIVNVYGEYVIVIADKN